MDESMKSFVVTNIWHRVTAESDSDKTLPCSKHKAGRITNDNFRFKFNLFPLPWITL